MSKRNVRYTTEAGTASWPHLDSPDTQFDKDGVYSVSLRLTKEAAEPLLTQMTEVVNEFVESGKAKSKKMAPLPVKDVEESPSKRSPPGLPLAWKAWWRFLLGESPKSFTGRAVPSEGLSGRVPQSLGSREEARADQGTL